VLDTANKTIAPVVEPVKQQLGQKADPVLSTVNDTAEPLIGTVEKTTEPLVGTVEKTAEPVTEPVLQTVRPVVGPTAPEPTLAAGMPAGTNSSFSEPVAAANPLYGGAASPVVVEPPFVVEGISGRSADALAVPHPTNLSVPLGGGVEQEGTRLDAALSSGAGHFSVPQAQPLADWHLGAAHSSLAATGSAPNRAAPGSPGPAAPAPAGTSSGGLVSGSGAGGLLLLGALALLFALSPAGGRLLRHSRDILRPNSALVLAIERPG
jgi:hypothetical protein